MNLVRGLVTAILVGIGIDLLPGVFLLALESGVGWIGAVGVILHTVALGVSIWLVSRWRLRVSASRRLQFALLAILQFPGALMFGAVFAIRRYQLRKG